jgi:hypothetical protein
MTDGNKSLPIFDLTYRLTLKINQAVVKLPRHQRPGLEDRVALRALKQALLPRLEPSLSYDTYTGLPGRGVHRTVARVTAFQRRVASPTAPRCRR